MEGKTTDIWFGPGAQKGVFGAGVAFGLHESIAKGEIDASQISLYGSSIGCLTAVFLATGNAACGLDIFQEETRQLAVVSNLVPALAARTVNRLARVTRLTKQKSWLPVPNVLNLDHIFAVMARRTPDVVEQLSRSETPVYAETVDPIGNYRYTELRSAADPLDEIRRSIHLFPFTHMPDSPWLDSGIKGYGFVDLLRANQRPLVVVLNAKPTSRSNATLADLTCSTLAVNPRIAKLYLRRRGDRFTACQQAIGAGRNLLLIYPSETVKLKDRSGYAISHALGTAAARQIVSFLQEHR